MSTQHPRRFTYTYQGVGETVDVPAYIAVDLHPGYNFRDAVSNAIPIKYALDHLPLRWDELSNYDLSARFGFRGLPSDMRYYINLYEWWIPIKFNNNDRLIELDAERESDFDVDGKKRTTNELHIFKIGLQPSTSLENIQPGLALFTESRRIMGEPRTTVDLNRHQDCDEVVQAVCKPTIDRILGEWFDHFPYAPEIDVSIYGNRVAVICRVCGRTAASALVRCAAFGNLVVEPVEFGPRHFYGRPEIEKIPGKPVCVIPGGLLISTEMPVSATYYGDHEERFGDYFVIARGKDGNMIHMPPESREDAIDTITKLSRERMIITYL